MPLRFLADECCPQEVVDALLGSEHDVRLVSATHGGATDIVIAEIALADDRLIITNDYDFGELAVRRRIPMVGVVLLTPSAMNPRAQAPRVTLAIANLENQLRGCLTIIGDDRLRVRRL